MLDPAVFGMWIKANFRFVQMGMLKDSDEERFGAQGPFSRPPTLECRSERDAVPRARPATSLL